MSDMDIKLQWNPRDQDWVAVFMRDDEPWFLNGALVGMGPTPGGAVDELCALARHLIIEGNNFLTNGDLSLPDRCWLYSMLEPMDNEAMYFALRQAFGSSTVKMLETIRTVRTEPWDLPDEEEID